MRYYGNRMVLACHIVSGDRVPPPCHAVKPSYIGNHPNKKATSAEESDQITIYSIRELVECC